MKNIFENAYFGKAYRTRGDKRFVYLGEVESLLGHDSVIQGMLEDDDILTYYNSEGKSLYCEYKGSAINAFDIDFSQVNCEEDCETDIVSEWQEEINEDELECIACEDIPLWCYSEPEYLDIYKYAFKACYRKVKEK